jgi:hypothetical protein
MCQLRNCQVKSINDIAATERSLGIAILSAVAARSFNANRAILLNTFAERAEFALAAG